MKKNIADYEAGVNRNAALCRAFYAKMAAGEYTNAQLIDVFNRASDEMDEGTALGCDWGVDDSHVCEAGAAAAFLYERLGEDVALTATTAAEAKEECVLLHSCETFAISYKELHRTIFGELTDEMASCYRKAMSWLDKAQIKARARVHFNKVAAAELA